MMEAIRRGAKQVLFSLVLFGLSWNLSGCGANVPSAQEVSLQTNSGDAEVETIVSNETNDDALATATFAGGCFWCLEQPFDQLPGVASTVSGYTGGDVENPTYTQVSNGNTGHVEAMQVSYDPEQVSYETLLDTFWHNIDPLDDYGQFCDKGSQYRSAVFYETPEQQALAVSSKEALAEEFEQPIATDIRPAAPFYPAEDYHQNYYQTRPVRYKVYRFGCGRDQRLADIWGDDAPSHD